jgi:hypothetical protein
VTRRVWARAGRCSVRTSDLALRFRQATCPACGYHIAAPFYDGGGQPLATLAWPRNAAEAQAMQRLPLSFVRCVDCGHVFNVDFDYAAVPYSDKPNLMFNRGRMWAEYIISVQDYLAGVLPPKPCVVEIGYGDGSFLHALAERLPGGQCVGFDPNGARATDTGDVVFRQELFNPARHVVELCPDLIISRHVLEHLTNPLAFLQGINFAAAASGVQPCMYFEVPCIDRALECARTVDFYYEHNSHFTSESFRRMLERSGATTERIELGYGGEVICGLLRTRASETQLALAERARDFGMLAESALSTIGLQLVSLHVSGRSVAIWGGTGKSAAFINRYGLDAERFPIVVDSDASKAGTFVPGTGQEIRHRDWLIAHPTDVIIVPPQWRAADIVLEMSAAGILCESVLLEHAGQLVDYFTSDHPYRGIEVRAPAPESPVYPSTL